MKFVKFAFSCGVRLVCAPLLTVLLASLSSAQTVSSVTLNPASVPAVVSTTGTVTLSAAAPSGGAVVKLSSSNSSLAQVPATVTVPAKARSATFPITTSSVTSQQTATITGTYNSSSQKAALTVRIPLMVTAAGGFLGDNNLATQACIEFPQFGGLDGKGNLYIADSYGDRIREVGAGTGKIFTVAGVGQYGYNGEGIKATTTAMGFPRGLVVNPAGEFWYSDPGNNRVRMVNSSGDVNTVAGNGTAGYKGDGGLAISAEINQPSGLALDASGNLYFSDTGNNVVRMVNTSGNIHTIAGNGTAGFSGDGGAATSASLNSPHGLAFDTSGNLYIADDLNNRVRIVSGLGSGTVTINTYAGDGNPGVAGDGGLASKAAVGLPRGVLVANGTLYISDAGQSRVRAVNLKSQIINTVAGSTGGYNGDGNAPLKSMFLSPTGLMVDSAGDLLIVDTGNDRVRKVNAAGTTVSTIVGGYVGDGGAATNACLNSPENIAFNSSGSFFIVEAGNRLREVTSGNISTLAGTGVTGYSGDKGPGSGATVNSPMGVAADKFGNVYIADTGNDVIRVVNSSKEITTFDKDSTFKNLASLTTDSAGNVYSVDSGACVVRKLTPAASSMIVAGVLNDCGYNGDSIPATTARLNQPFGVALDAAGNIYIGDAGNNRVRKVTVKTEVISTIAGTGTCGYSGDGGKATSAELCTPSGVAVDPVGRIFIADYSNFRVRLLSTNGVISTYAGTGLPGYNNNGRLATKTNLGGPIAVAIGPSNVLYVADDQSYRIRVIQ